ncbi:hypothetical protein [Streptomyces sp. CAU 1734]|uniref:alpha-amylase family glycosyl hydrolase n=1 Tax=Streptomyces sp. CAU 1734 TaxID=3140360 RepID=UPI0032608E54
MIYRICVTTFLDTTGDGVGDLAGVRAGLPYISDLGVDGIRLTRLPAPLPAGSAADTAPGRIAGPGYAAGEAEELGLLAADAGRYGLRLLVPGPAGAARDGVTPSPFAGDRAGTPRPGATGAPLLCDPLSAGWDADAVHRAVTGALHDAGRTGTTVTWALDSGHRPRAALGFPADGGREAARARAAALLTLALPGAAQLHQGEELGLPGTRPPESAGIRRLTGRRTPHEGVRPPRPRSGHGSPPAAPSPPEAVPLAATPPPGPTAPVGHVSPFGDGGPRNPAPSWLPRPGRLTELPADRAIADPDSRWHLYRTALGLRRALGRPGDGAPRLLETLPGVLAFVRDGLVCAVNFNDWMVPAPVPGTPLVISGPCTPGTLSGNAAAWWPADALTAGPAGRRTTCFRARTGTDGGSPRMPGARRAAAVPDAGNTTDPTPATPAPEAAGPAARRVAAGVPQGGRQMPGGLSPAGRTTPARPGSQEAESCGPAR